MAWTFVQSTSDFTAATFTLTLGAAVTSGNFLNGGGLLPPGVYLTKVTDNGAGGSNVYDLVPGGDNNAGAGSGGDVVFGFRSRDLITNGPTVLTFTTTSAPAGFFFKAVEEWSPPVGTPHVSLDGHTNFLNYTTTSPPNMSGTDSSLFTTLNSNVFLWGFVWQGGTLTPGSGWSNQMSGGASNMFTYNNATMAASPNSANKFTFSANSSNIYGVFWGTAPVAQANWKPVQTGQFTFNSTSSNTFTASLAGPAAIGDVILGGFGAISGGTVTIQDNLGGTNYSVLVNDIPQGHCIWWSNGPLTTTPTSFTITSTVSSVRAGTVVEFAPPPGKATVAVDVDGFTDYFTAPSITTLSTSLTTAKSGDLVYTWISSGASLSDVPLNGFNMLSNWGQKNSDSYFIQQNAGAISSGWNFQASQGVIVFAAALSASSPAPSAGIIGLVNSEF